MKGETSLEVSGRQVVDRESFAAHDWENTPLGPRDTWPPQLRFLGDFLLRSKQPMFILWGPERACIFNAAYQEVWAIPSLKTLGCPVKEVPSDAWHRLHSRVDQVFQGHSFAEVDFPIAVSPDDEPRYFDFSYTPIRDYDDYSDEIVGALCITTDVSARVLAAERLKAERRILGLTVENVTEGVALVESDFKLVLWNESFRRHFGYAPGQLAAGINAAELMLETASRGDLGDDNPEKTVHALLQKIRTTESGTLEIHRQNGKVLWILRRTIRGGRHLLVSRDVTEERKTARLKDELVSTVSHELRTPLTAISAALGIVAGGAAGELSEKSEKLIQIAQRNSGRLITLVNDLLDIDRLESGKAELHLHDVDLGILVMVAVEQHQPYAENAGVRLIADLPPAPIWVKLDRNRMLQVLANLISNAVKFSPSGESVIVRLRADLAQARISVIDHGPGIPEEFRSQLFERFTQHDSSTSRVQQGTGLGLTISKSIMEQLGGSIELDPTTAKGATFHVDLPITDC